MGARTLAIFSLLSIVMVSCGPVDDPNSLKGKSAPDFQIESLQSKNITASLASFKGKAVIIDFWATWCGPCRMLSPHVEKIYQDFKSKGLVAMAVTDQDRKTVLGFEASTPHQMPVYIDQNDIATLSFHVQALPTIIIVDKNGNVVYDEAGFGEGQIDVADAAMRAAVKTAIGPT